LPGFAGIHSLPEKESRNSAEKGASGSIPEELKQAGRQILESLDWEIRFLERQRAEIHESKKR
jgi:hypothetical protein